MSFITNNTSGMKSVQFIRILDINFLNGGYSHAKKLLMKGGLMVVPAAPALASIRQDRKYYNAIKESDFAIADSSLMVIIWMLINRKRLKNYQVKGSYIIL